MKYVNMDINYCFPMEIRLRDGCRELEDGGTNPIFSKSEFKLMKLKHLCAKYGSHRPLITLGFNGSHRNMIASLKPFGSIGLQRKL
jgi:hypothetical protein